MHEYSLLQGVLDAILKELEKPGLSPGGKIQEVVLKVGALEIHSEAATRQAFQVLARGTILEQARLNLTILPATIACSQCAFKGPLPQDAVDHHNPSPLAECPACGAVSPVLNGRGVEAIEVIWE
jgi:hydrogenase nickel incorporation protein HypA/HybF